MKLGDKGKDVEVAQLALQVRGYYKGRIDGDFGPLMEAAVVKFEQEYYCDAELDDIELTYLANTVQAPGSITAQTGTKLPPVPRGYDELVRLFGRPWEDGTSDGSAWWLKWQAPAKLPEVFTLNKSDVLYVNKYIDPVVELTFAELAKRGLAQYVVTFDGCFRVRPVRGYENVVPPRYSVHTWGMAIDVNAATNELGVKPALHPDVVRCFKEFGWVWGGDFKRLDGMHFQYATGV